MEKLTNLEEMIMKCIWDYGEEIPKSEKERLKGVLDDMDFI